MLDKLDVRNVCGNRLLLQLTDGSSALLCLRISACYRDAGDTSLTTVYLGDRLHLYSPKPSLTMKLMAQARIWLSTSTVSLIRSFFGRPSSLRVDDSHFLMTLWRFCSEISCNVK